MASTEEINWQALGVFTDDDRITLLATVYLASTVGFYIAYKLSFVVYPILMSAFIDKNSPYYSLNDKSLREYHSRNVADLHALITAPLSTYAVFYSCADPDHNIYSSN